MKKCLVVSIFTVLMLIGLLSAGCDSKPGACKSCACDKACHCKTDGKCCCNGVCKEKCDCDCCCCK